jgi:glucokinase
MSGESKLAMVAVDLGGTNLRVALFSADGTQQHRTGERTLPDDPSALAEAVSKTLDVATRRGYEVDRAVIAVPGWVDHASNTIVLLPNLPAWGSMSGSDLAARIGLAVTFANDADLAALGEHRFGAGIGCDNMVYLTCSTGVGAGVILGGRMLRGGRSVVEIGHTVIDWRTGDTVEELGSGTALARLAGMPAEEVAARAAAGDAKAQRQFRRTADAFAVGALNMALLFAPDRIVIGGGMSEAGELLLGPVRERFAMEPSPLLSTGPEQIVRAERGQDAGLLGAFALWADETGQIAARASAR